MILKKIPLICIPTTIGTGNEISKNIVVKNHKTGRKHRIIEEAVRADFMMIDIHTLEDADRLIEMMIQKDISINPVSIFPQQIKQMIYQACNIKRQE